MSYTSIQTKLGRLKKGDPLPVDMLAELPRFSRWFSLEGKSYLLQDFAFLISNLVFERVSPGPDDSLVFITASLIFKNGDRGFIELKSSDFYKTSLMEDYKNRYFKLLKPGKIAFVAENFVSILTSQELIFDGLESHKSSCPALLEGTPVLVLKTLMLDSVPLVKVLYGEKSGWVYGVLYDKDFCDSQENNNHWL